MITIGVASVKADHTADRVDVTYDRQVISLKAIYDAIEEETFKVIG
jgi:copper chaperone CopZ